MMTSASAILVTSNVPSGNTTGSFSIYISSSPLLVLRHVTVINTLAVDGGGEAGPQQ